MKRPRKLSAAFVKTVKRPGRYGDGRGGFGLSLLVKPTTTGRLSKTWNQRLRIHGHPVNVGLGAYAVVTLAEAREAALKNRRMVAQGPRSPLGRHSDVRRGCGNGNRDSPPLVAVGGQVRSPVARHAAALRVAADRPQAGPRDHDR